MSYLVLARKWRPKTFADTVGQEHVLKALVNALESGRLHHAYLFAGTRGVGKTTIARILAKALNCEKGITAEPCGECGPCREIDEGRFVDLIEVDAASKTKVDDTRELLDNVQYSPARGRFKVYLIDEVHMLSKSSFNALLKTLEEPPPHVKFLFATTDPQKLPVTVLSRCLQFNLTRLTPRLIGDRLSYICEQESVEAEPAALALIARAADGSLRDALSLLDQAIAFCGGSVAERPVAEMLGTIDLDYVMRLLELLAANDGAGLLETVATIDAQFPDYARLLDDLARVLQRIAIIQVIGPADTEEEYDSEALERLAGRIPDVDVQLFYQTALIGRRDLPLAPDPRTGAEMTLLRMLAFRPASAGATSSGAAEPSAARSAGSGAGQATRPASGSAAAASPGDDAKDAAPGVTDWAKVIADLPLKGAARMLAMNCAFERRDGNTIRFHADRNAESMLTPARQRALAEALSAHLGETVEVSITLADAPATELDTPMRRENRETDEQYRAARAALEADPNVKALKHMFSAELKTDSIEPIQRNRSD